MIRNNFIAKSLKYNTINNHQNAPVFRKEFEIKNHYEYIVLKICGLGFYKLFVNGKDITKGLLAPYISNPNDNIYLDEYNIKNYLIIGKNVINVILGNGFINSNDNNLWDFEKASFRSSPMFSLEIVADKKVILKSDDSFKVNNFAITFDDLRCGEHYDARIYNSYYFLVGYNDNDWNNAIKVKPPKGEIIKSNFEPIVVEKQIEYISYFENNKGYIFDFGEINSGIYKLKISGNSGQKLKLTFGEIINDNDLDLTNISFGDRSPKNYIQSDEYILTNGYQEYSPSFTYHGFRYVLIEGLRKEQITKNLITYLVCHSDIKIKGKFYSDNQIINKIQDCALRSDTSNFYYFPTDCPQREKNGWTADASLSAEQLTYNFDTYKSLRAWLNNIKKSQKESGALPGIVPTSGWGYEWGNGPAWDSVLIELPYQLYKFYGKKEILKENYKSIIKYFHYLETRINENGLIAFGLGDWCETGTYSEELYSTPIEITDTLVSINLIDKTIYILNQLNLNNEISFFIQLKKRLVNSFLSKYYINNSLTIKTQTALALTIKSKILSKNQCSVLFKELLKQISLKQNHFCVGVIGVKVLFDVLCDYGKPNLALELITKNSFPSYAYNLNLGATTLFEGFHKINTQNGNFKREDKGTRLLSLNHHFWGSISAWFYKYVAGIKIENYKKVIIEPELSIDINKVQAEYYFNKNSYIKIFMEKNKLIKLKILSKNVDCKVSLKDNYTLKSGENYFEHKGEKEYVLYRN